MTGMTASGIKVTTAELPSAERMRRFLAVRLAGHMGTRYAAKVMGAPVATVHRWAEACDIESCETEAAALCELG
jgi:hypothetical protein